jgi:DNA-binding NtrC family response regulator
MRQKSKSFSNDSERHLSPDLIESLDKERLIQLVMQAAAENPETFNQITSAVSRSVAEAAEAAEASDKTDNAEHVDHMVGSSKAMLDVFSTIRKVAAVDAPVLITGESGTGKELAALAIHERSARSGSPLIPINCAGLPPTLINSELFGYEKGAFTGASSRRMGRIEAANGGTLFLDEIGDIPMELQAHLLRFLQEQTIDRLGGNRPISVNVRVLAATNTDLEAAVKAGQFREDLFYRLNVLTVKIPPLRERTDDVELLCTYFLHKFSNEIGREELKFDEPTIEALRAYSWPGNVRELISYIRRGVVMAEGDSITVHDLGMPMPDESDDGTSGTQGGPAGGMGGNEPELAGQSTRVAQNFDAQSACADKMSLAAAKSRFEREIIQTALKSHDKNVTRTAEDLGVSRVTLYRLIAKHELHDE